MNKQMVRFNDAGLYAVYVGEMIGQFSDGYWENSTYHKSDWKLFSYDNVELVNEEITELPKIRYDINRFFRYVKQKNIECIIKRVLMLYRLPNLVKKAYNESPEEAERLINVLESVEYADKFKEWGGNRYETAIKYFGTIENLKAMTPVIDKNSLKEFTRIGRSLNSSFKHVRNFYELF